MKRLLLLLIVMLLALVLFSCEKPEPEPRPEYFWAMDILIDPKPLDKTFFGSNIWASRYMVLNPNETLYYIPVRIVRVDHIYINDRETYMIERTGFAGLKSYVEPNDEKLALIFQDIHIPNPNE